MNIVIGVSGASGTIYAVKLLEALREVNDVNTHLVLSDWAIKNLEIETEYSLEYLESLANRVYNNRNMGSTIASGSFITNGMIIIPCSMKTLSAIANGYADSLIVRVADVMLKEGRKLIICPRETPLNQIHLENMLKLSRQGVCIVPPMPAFYNMPQTIDDIINHTVMKVLDQFGIHLANDKRWNG